MSGRKNKALWTSTADAEFMRRDRRAAWLGLLAAAQQTLEAKGLESREQAAKDLRLYVSRLVEMGAEPTPGKETG
jgi:hypothetical protein